MELGIPHERKPIKRLTKFEDVKRFPKPKRSVELPFDVIVSVLTMLPSRHLQRMRSVCRSWSSLISDSHFIREYSKFRASVTKRTYTISLHCFFGWQNDRKMTLLLKGDDDHCESDMHMDLVGGELWKISNSCDGLICVVDHTSTYLVNPSIQKIRTLVSRSWRCNIAYFHSTGLGFNDSTGEYKVVRLFNHEVGQQVYLECEVHTVGNLHPPSCWKAIDSPPLEPSCIYLPVFVNGTIYWTVSSDPDKVPPEVALSFDVKNDKFDVILHPEGSSRPPCSRVVELEGLLCLACTHLDEVQMDIWVLKDYNNREWIKRYNIDLSTIHDYMTTSPFWTIPVTIHDGKIVFCNRYGGRDYYDLQSKSFVKHMHFSTGFMYDTAYTESIVWPLAPMFFLDTTLRLG